MQTPASISCLFIALTGVVVAQESAPRGIFHARFVSSSGTPDAGGLIFQTTNGTTLRCSWDADTWFEREHERIPAAALQPGERIEIVDAFPLTSVGKVDKKSLRQIISAKLSLDRQQPKVN